MTKTVKKTKLTPDAWVLTWWDGFVDYTKNEAYAEFWRTMGVKVRPIYYGWGAAAACPMGGK
jgi:hypothetical protein